MVKYWARWREQDGEWTQWYPCSYMDYVSWKDMDDCEVKIE